MDLTQFTIGKACFDENKVYLGKLDKKGRTWLHKKDITDTFLHLMVSYVGEDKSLEIFANGKPKYKITVEKVKKQ